MDISLLNLGGIFGADGHMGMYASDQRSGLTQLSAHVVLAQSSPAFPSGVHYFLWDDNINYHQEARHTGNSWNRKVQLWCRCARAAGIICLAHWHCICKMRALRSDHSAHGHVATCSACKKQLAACDPSSLSFIIIIIKRFRVLLRCLAMIYAW